MFLTSCFIFITTWPRTSTAGSTFSKFPFRQALCIAFLITLCRTKKQGLWNVCKRVPPVTRRTGCTDQVILFFIYNYFNHHDHLDRLSIAVCGEYLAIFVTVDFLHSFVQTQKSVHWSQYEALHDSMHCSNCIRSQCQMGWPGAGTTANANCFRNASCAFSCWTSSYASRSCRQLLPRSQNLRKWILLFWSNITRHSFIDKQSPCRKGQRRC